MGKITSSHLSFFVGILFFVCSLCSLLRLRTHNKSSAQLSNEICSGINDRFGIQSTVCYVYIAKWLVGDSKMALFGVFFPLCAIIHPYTYRASFQMPRVRTVVLFTVFFCFSAFAI